MEATTKRMRLSNSMRKSRDKHTPVKQPPQLVPSFFDPFQLEAAVPLLVFARCGSDVVHMTIVGSANFCGPLKASV